MGLGSELAGLQLRLLEVGLQSSLGFRGPEKVVVVIL